MKQKFKLGDIVRILPEYREDPAIGEEEAVREIIYVDETDEELPYQLDGDDDFRLKWRGDDMLELSPKSIPNNSNLEKLEYRNLPQDTANCDKFTLTAEEAILLRYALGDAILYCDKYSKEKDSAIYSEKYMKMFDKVTQWLSENEI